MFCDVGTSQQDRPAWHRHTIILKSEPYHVKSMLEEHILRTCDQKYGEYEIDNNGNYDDVYSQYTIGNGKGKL